MEEVECLPLSVRYHIQDREQYLTAILTRLWFRPARVVAQAGTSTSISSRDVAGLEAVHLEERTTAALECSQ